MITLKRARTFLFYNTQTKRLLLEAFLLLAWARVLKRRPFQRIASSLGEGDSEISFTLDPCRLEMLKPIAHAIAIMSRYTFWESQCLVQAIAAMKMLEKRQIESTLYLGTAKDESGKLVAHAWLRSGSYYVTGSSGKERFTVVAKFANRKKHEI